MQYRKVVYLTHCSAEKDPALKASRRPVTPDELYTDAQIQQFIMKCKSTGVSWAVLSDLYGVYWSHERREWYEKHPDSVTPQEETRIIQDFDCQLGEYAEIWFYMRPESFHPFYARVLKRSRLANRVQMFRDTELVRKI